MKAKSGSTSFGYALKVSQSEIPISSFITIGNHQQNSLIILKKPLLCFY